MLVSVLFEWMQWNIQIGASWWRCPHWRTAAEETFHCVVQVAWLQNKTNTLRLLIKLPGRPHSALWPPPRPPHWNPCKRIIWGISVKVEWKSAAASQKHLQMGGANRTELHWLTCCTQSARDAAAPSASTLWLRPPNHHHRPFRPAGKEGVIAWVSDCRESINFSQFVCPVFFIYFFNFVLLCAVCNTFI